MSTRAKARSGKRKPSLARYTAKLLFQFRVVVNGDSGSRRLCEERMILFRARGAKAGLTEAKRRGRAAQHRYKNSYGQPVYFEFVGVLELLELGGECEKDEVWWRLVERVKPMERRAQILPPERELNALR